MGVETSCFSKLYPGIREKRGFFVSKGASGWSSFSLFLFIARYLIYAWHFHLSNLTILEVQGMKENTLTFMFFRSFERTNNLPLARFASIACIDLGPGIKG